MIKFNGMNCWSPLEPTAYAPRSEGFPSQPYSGPVGQVVDRVMGGEGWKAVGGNPAVLESALPEWNLVWLTCPQIDQMVELSKLEYKWKAVNALHQQLIDEGLYNYLVETMTFALDWQGLLLESPQQFLRRTKAAKVSFPRMASLEVIEARAGLAREAVQQATQSNVIPFLRKPSIPQAIAREVCMMKPELLQLQQGTKERATKDKRRAVGERRIPEVELLRDYRRVEMMVGHPPTLEEMKALGKFHVSTYSRRYGTWSKFREELGSPVDDGRVTREQLIANYYAVKDKLGRIPTVAELGEHGQYGVRTYHKYFGGHKKLLALLNEKPEKQND